MKSMLKFNLPEEREEFDAAINGGKYKGMLDDIHNVFRTYRKYKSDELTEDQNKIIEQ